MTRSTALLFSSAALGLPAWVIDVHLLSAIVQALWIALMLGVAGVGGYFWAIDRK